MLRSLFSFVVAVAPAAVVAGLPPLPDEVSSFGAAAVGEQVYVYGGHTGPAHSYSVDDQSGALRRLDLSNPSQWEELPSGPKLQGLALVSHGGKVYRLGGFTAMNAEGEDNKLQSQAGVAVFDPQAGSWNDLTPLPEPRSSFDAAVLGDRVYVAGGWNLHDDGDGDWHTTAWSADLMRRPLVWEKLPDPPFLRRAVAVAAHAGKVYILGGMGQTGGPTRRVDVFDVKTGAWSQRPDLLGEKPIDGFGGAACVAGGGVCFSSLAGVVQRLSDDGGKWEVVAPFDPPRFFHRMLPCDGGAFVVGGSNMTDGKIAAPAIVPVLKSGG